MSLEKEHPAVYLALCCLDSNLCAITVLKMGRKSPILLRVHTSNVASLVSLTQAATDTNILNINNAISHWHVFYRTTDSPVYSPENGDLWALAKENFQVTDFAYVEMVEHLLKTHLMMEPFCVCILRHLSKLHPLHQLLKYHCR